MKQILLILTVVVLVGCGKKPAEELVLGQERPDATKPSKPPAKSEAQIEPEAKAFAEAKAKAEAGDAIAQYNLGVMYRKGQGVEQDSKEAFKWYQKAAGLGHAGAQNNLGVMYGRGLGVERDYVTAFAWASIAATNGDTISPRFKSEFLEPKMTPAQMAETEELVKEIIKKNPKLLK